jgi:hypothetical protein
MESSNEDYFCHQTNEGMKMEMMEPPAMSKLLYYILYEKTLKSQEPLIQVISINLCA